MEVIVAAELLSTVAVSVTLGTSRLTSKTLRHNLVTMCRLMVACINCGNV